MAQFMCPENEEQRKRKGDAFIKQERISQNFKKSGTVLLPVSGKKCGDNCCKKKDKMNKRGFFHISAIIVVSMVGLIKQEKEHR